MKETYIQYVSDCSPNSSTTFVKTGSCLRESDQAKIATALNTSYIDRATLKKHVPGCRGETSDSCLVDDQRLWSDEALRLSLQRHFRPKRPKAWDELGKERSWLSNSDIDSIMEQYSHIGFRYMGSMPSDFSNKTSEGICVKDGMCDFDAGTLGTDSFGFIFNLDVHTGSGTHWTSMYGCVDPGNVKYGVFFFCSYGKPPPIGVKALMDLICLELETVHPGIQMCKGYNTKRFQQKHSECGIFSCAFLIRCLENTTETYERALSRLGNDDEVFLLRSVLFRK